MSIWFREYSIDDISALQRGNMGAHIGIEIVRIGPDHLVGRMPVDERTTQPDRILHGGASVALAETLGSVGGAMVVDRAVLSHKRRPFRRWTPVARNALDRSRPRRRLSAVL